MLKNKNEVRVAQVFGLDVCYKSGILAAFEYAEWTLLKAAISNDTKLRDSHVDFPEEPC